MAHAVVAADDFFFISKIKEAARQTGTQLAFATDLREIVAQAARPEARLVIIDLNAAAFDPLAALAALKADPSASRPTCVGYLSHVMVDLRKAAEAAGCDRVVARSAFVKLLPDLLTQAAG